jgi:general secretion pathway protein F
VARLEKEFVEGRTLSEILKRSRLLPPSVGFVAAVGEESGDLAEVFGEVADTYHDEEDVASTRLTVLLNPALVVTLASWWASSWLPSCFPLRMSRKSNDLESRPGMP